MRTPYQWFNFFEFWRDEAGAVSRRSRSSMLAAAALTLAAAGPARYAAATAGAVARSGCRH